MIGRPSLAFRIFHALPCWLVGHLEVQQDPIARPGLLWCLKCDRRRRR